MATNRSEGFAISWYTKANRLRLSQCQYVTRYFVNGLCQYFDYLLQILMNCCVLRKDIQQQICKSSIYNNGSKENVNTQNISTDTCKSNIPEAQPNK